MFSIRSIGKAIYEMRPIKWRIPQHADAIFATSTNLKIRDFSKLEAEGRLNEASDYIMGAKGIVQEVDAEFRRLTGQLLPRRKYYRGIADSSYEEHEGLKVLHEAKVGDAVCPDRGYAFASRQRGIGQDYAFINDPAWANRPRMLLEIRTPIGSKLSHNSSHLGEVVFPRNAQFKVLKKEERKDGFTKVVLKYLLPKS